MNIQGNLNNNGMSTLVNNFDSIETLIFDEGVRISEVRVDKETDMLSVVLNTGAVIQDKLSAHPPLVTATVEELCEYELVGNGVGIYWSALDEDISLKGLLRDDLKMRISGAQIA